MNVKGMLHRFWRNNPLASVEKPVNENQGALPGSYPQRPDLGSNVVALPVKPHHAGFFIAGVSEPLLTKGVETEPLPPRIKGLMNAPELELFFQDHHFGLGRHNGANYRSHEALMLGKNALLSRFQNVVGDLIARRLEKFNKLQLELIAIEGISQAMSDQLRLACEQLQRDIAVLEKQDELSHTEQGWVRDALNQYQIGFSKGLREVIDFDLLAQ